MDPNQVHRPKPGPSGILRVKNAKAQFQQAADK